MPEDDIRAQTIEQLIAEWQSAGNAAGQKSGRPLNVIAVGAHPDDVETGCGGAFALFAQQGHSMHLVHLTRGEAGRMWETSAPTADGPLAVIRTIEAEKSCKKLHAKPHFVGQIDRETVTDEEHSREFTRLLLATKPDIVFTHWPQDTHPDHRNAFRLTYDAWEASGRSFTLVCYEVMTKIQTQDFTPNCFVDIDQALQLKHDAIYCHQSQGPDRFYNYHVAMEEQRGRESHCSRAEAFFVVPRSAPKL